LANYHFVTTYHLPAPITAVWDALRRFDAYPTWSRGFIKSRERISGGRPTVAYRVRGRLPYTLAFEAEVSRSEPPTLLELRVHGELEGVGLWTLQQEDGITAVRYTWDVATKKAWMNLLAPIARPIFEWNHDAVMKDFGIGLARYLGVPLLPSTGREARGR
jgi:uncharacterized protein YndB with AHSA1/START domain